MKLRKGLISFFAFSLIFIFIPAFLLVAATGISLISDKTNSAFMPIYMIVLGLASSAIFIPICIWMFKKLFSIKSGLIFTSDGFRDNANMTASDFIAWAEIIKIEEQSRFNQKYISIHTTNPNKYLNRGNFIQRRLKRSTMRRTGTPICISVDYLKISHEELNTLFYAWFADFQK